MHKVRPRAGKQPEKIKQAAKVWLSLALWPSNPDSLSSTSQSIQMDEWFLDNDDGGDDFLGSSYD